MSQCAVEQVLGKLLTDEGFRRQFFEDPHRACFLFGLRLSPVELEAVMRIPRTPLAALSRCLDDRIRRLHVPPAACPEDRTR
jgi:hypothetical protein